MAPRPAGIATRSPLQRRQRLRPGQGSPPSRSVRGSCPGTRFHTPGSGCRRRPSFPATAGSRRLAGSAAAASCANIDRPACPFPSARGWRSPPSAGAPLRESPSRYRRPFRRERAAGRWSCGKPSRPAKKYRSGCPGTRLLSARGKHKARSRRRKACAPLPIPAPDPERRIRSRET